MSILERLEVEFLRYLDVKSEFIKKLIKGASWKKSAQRKYIDDLIEVERYILKGPKGFADAMRAGSFKHEYGREWETIYKELKPKEYEDLQREEERRREERRRNQEMLREKLKAQEESLKKEWLQMGGTE